MVPDFLLQQSELIRSCDPSSQSVTFFPETWQRQLGWNRQYRNLAGVYRGCISRGDLFKIATAAYNSPTEDKVISLFVGTMLWGYGTTGYGAWRTDKMLKTPAANRTIMCAWDLVCQSRVLEAYRICDLDRCGPAFFTKFFYFAGRGGSIAEYPLILDNIVYETLKSYLGTGVDKYVKRSTWWWPEGYQRYTQDMHSWASDLGVAADQIELHLFSAGS